MSLDAALLLVFISTMYIVWYVYDAFKPSDDDNNPFAGWW